MASRGVPPAVVRSAAAALEHREALPVCALPKVVAYPC